MIDGSDAAARLRAFRDIRRTDGAIDDLAIAKKLSTDPVSAIRAEAASAMRDRKFSESQEVLVNVAKGYNGSDRSYLEVFGIGAGHNTEVLWKALLEAMKPDGRWHGPMRSFV